MFLRTNLQPSGGIMNFLSNFLCSLTVIFLFISCGNVKTASVNAYRLDNELNLLSKVTFNKRIGVILDYADIPILNFQNHEIIGNLKMQNGNQIQLDLSLSKIFNAQISDDILLPNGRQLPFILNDGVKIFSFEESSTHVKVFVAVDDMLAVAGIAIPISGMPFDSSLDPFNFFLPFNIKGVKGAAGTFHGPNDGQNGVAIFYNVTAQLKPFISKSNRSNLVLDTDILNKILNMNQYTIELELDPKMTRLSSKQKKVLKEVKKFF